VAHPLLDIADELYAGALGDFTPARDARAKELKAAGETELAALVKSLRKASLAAWVVDLLVRRQAEQVEQVLAMGAALREAQAGMSGEELRALTRQRRQLTAAITQQARSLAGEEGVKVTPAVADQVEATLTAAMLDERCGQAVRSGLLVTALAATGVDEVDVASAVAVPDALGFVAPAREAEPPARPDLKVVPDPDAAAKARAAAEQALAEAEEEVVAARSTYDDTMVDVERLQARQLQLEAEMDELRRRIAELEETYDEVEDELGDADAGRADAFAALEEATSERDAAARRLEELR
jgi:hypothetical protein